MDAIVETRTQGQPDFTAIKTKQKATWEDGDYHGFATYMHDGAVEILNSWDLAGVKTLLDVGCGSGQTAIPAALKGMRVTGVDIAENLIAMARELAAVTQLDAQFDVGDAEALPYADRSFDAVISLIGAMFAPRPERVVAEFARVLKPGGKLCMANWTPASMPAKMFKCCSEVVAPPPGLASPVLWGDEATIRERLAEHFTDIKLTRKNYPQWHYPFDEHELIELFRHKFGPVKRAFDMASPAQAKSLHEKLFHVYRDSSETSNGIMTITGGEYLDVSAVRR
ncbi:MAG: methyltransferase domain-containing protein [Gammaproteobacteria bacterium]|nr:methyltransferase domain-containing protein [Gammaproteobacteria bacterium]